MVPNNNDPCMNQLMNSVGPNFNIPGQHEGNTNTPNYPGSHPALFGENQFKDGFGPVYAVPTFPWSPPIPSNSQGMGNNPQPQNHTQNIGNNQQPQSHGQGMQWQQSCNCQQAMKGYYMYPHFMFPSFGHQHYQ